MRLSKNKGDELMKRSLSLVLVMLLVLSLVLTACGPKAPAQEPTPGEEPAAQEPKVLRFAIGAEPPALDQQIATDTYAIMLGNHLYEGLVRVADNGRVTPGMAESWEISEDGLTYTFHLRDAKWSDGQPVTAKDFEYGIKRLLDPATASEYAFQGYYIENGEAYNTGKITDPSQVGVKALDDKTLEIKLAVPTGYFLALTNFISLFPVRQDFIEAQGTAYASEADKILYNGPYILKEWKHEEGLVLEKNPNYWNKDAIKIDRVEIAIVTDSNTAMSMYEAGDLDFVGLPAARVQEFVDKGEAKFYYDGAEFYFQFNVKGRNAEVGKFTGNANFRKAFAYAIDRQNFVDAVLKNGSDPATRYVLPLLAGVNDLFAKEYPLEFYPKNADPAKAKEYLDKALAEIGTTVDKVPAIEYLTDDSDAARTSAEAIQDMIAKNLGIKLEIKQVPFKQRLELMNKGDYDLVFAGWGPDYDDPMTYLDLWVIDGGHNNTGWEDQTYTDMINFCKTTPDVQARADKMFEAEKYLLENGPIVPVYFRRRAWVHVDGLTGLIRNFIGADPDFTMADITR
jgi:oligopeptide transport system substrate-binding protein